MNDKELKELLAKYKDGTCSEEEKALLENWVTSVSYPEFQISEKDLLEDLAEIRSKLPLVPVKERTPWRNIAAAAILILALGGIWYFFGDNIVHPQNTIVKDIAPGGNRATLTLNNGKTIALSDAQSGIIIEERIAYADGSAVLTDSLQIINRKSSIVNLMSISTPRGGQYQVQLPDGTKVWLNAASSLKYPASFAGQAERRVELTGEAYFEVAKDADHPFIVQSDKQSVEVLGTHFNIKAYAEEPLVRTTLLEGSVKVSILNTQYSNLLTPGQQAILSDTEINVKEVNVENAVAWKNGYFMFNSENLESVMRKIARWYKVEVIFEDPSLKSETFFGSISRFENVSKMLEMLEATEVATFTVKGNKIYIQKKQ